MQFSSFVRHRLAVLFLAFAGLALAACGASEPSAPATNAEKPAATQSGKLNGWGRSLVKEDGCHPDIALALQPYEVDYGQCRMKTFDDVCGAGTFEKGVALIPVLFERDAEMLNPWGWACARSGNVENALTAGCMSRTNQSEETCRCAAKKTIEIEKAPLPELLSYTDNSDMITAKATYPEYLGILGVDSMSEVTEETARKQDEFQAVFQRHYTRMEKDCM